MQTCIGGATLVALARIRYTAPLPNTQTNNTILKRSLTHVLQYLTAVSKNPRSSDFYRII